MAEITNPNAASDTAEEEKKPKAADRPRYNRIDTFGTFEANRDEDATGAGRATGNVIGAVTGTAAGGIAGGIAGAVAGGALGSAADENSDDEAPDNQQRP